MRIDKVWVVGLLMSICPLMSMAHGLESYDTIGVIMHVSDNDDPIVGDVSRLLFTITDTTGNFSFPDCDCTVVIAEEGKTVFSASLPHVAEGEEASVDYIFPRQGMYTVRIEGVPREEGKFQSFTFTYDVEVSRERKETTVLSWFWLHAIHLGSVMLAVGWVVGFTWWDKRRERLQEQVVTTDV